MPRRRHRQPPVPFLLAEVLERMGVTKTELHERTRIPYSMLCRLEKPGANPTWSTVMQIAWALDISVADLGPKRRQQPGSGGSSQ